MKKICDYIKGIDNSPLFINGDALTMLQRFPDDSIDCCITSPPYWQKRQYAEGGIGLESTFTEYIDNLLAIIKEIKRVIKPSGAFWLNIGDSYRNKELLGIPWRVALKMMDDGWMLRNDVIWYKHKGGLCSSKDKFGDVYEDFFFFVKNDKYFFNDDAIRANPRKSKIVNGSVISSTGVSGIRYKRQIELSTSLTDDEKKEAMSQLDMVLTKMKNGEVADFRMVIRNEQRTTHSDSYSLSGRAKELKEKGFYFLFYNSKGAMPSNVWDILPEDTQHRKLHYAPFPEELCIIPIKATCPKGGIVLDPFCGTGTTMKVAYELGKKSIGIDLSKDYLNLSKERICQRLLNFSQLQQ
jgi:DNA modification methylase